MPWGESVFVVFYNSKGVSVAKLEWARGSVLEVTLEREKRQSQTL